MPGSQVRVLQDPFSVPGFQVRELQSLLSVPGSQVNVTGVLFVPGKIKRFLTEASQRFLQQPFLGLQEFGATPPSPGSPQPRKLENKW